MPEYRCRIRESINPKNIVHVIAESFEHAERQAAEMLKVDAEQVSVGRVVPKLTDNREFTG